MLRENNSKYRIEPVGAGLEIWVIMKIEKYTDQVYKQPNGLGRAISSQQIF